MPIGLPEYSDNAPTTSYATSHAKFVTAPPRDVFRRHRRGFTAASTVTDSQRMERRCCRTDIPSVEQNSRLKTRFQNLRWRSSYRLSRLFHCGTVTLLIVQLVALAPSANSTTLAEVASSYATTNKNDNSNNKAEDDSESRSAGGVDLGRLLSAAAVAPAADGESSIPEPTRHYHNHHHSHHHGSSHHVKSQHENSVGAVDEEDPLAGLPAMDRLQEYLARGLYNCSAKYMSSIRDLQRFIRKAFEELSMCRKMLANSPVTFPTSHIAALDAFINGNIKNKVRDSNWRIGPYRNGGSPNDTFGEIVNDSFEEAKRVSRCATHCTFSEMYSPFLGGLRTSKSYSALAPTNGMCPEDRRVAPDLRPYRSYTPKQGEWAVLKGQPAGLHRFQPAVHVARPANLPLPPMSRRQYPMPAETTRFENFSRYWNGRAKGLGYSQPFLHDVPRDNYEIMEDRRYQRLYWAPRFIPSQPSPRHARQIILTAY